MCHNSSSSGSKLTPFLTSIITVNADTNLVEIHEEMSKLLSKQVHLCTNYK